MFNRLTILVGAGLFACFLSPSANAEPPVVGYWQHDNQPTRIQIGPNDKLIICNEQQDCAEGIYSRSNTIIVPQWRVKGSLNPAGNIITWSNGTRWIKNDSRGRNHYNLVGGSWVHDGRHTSIRMRRDGIHFILINEVGQVSKGYIRNKELFLPDLNVTGRLHKRGNVIKWSNGTTWYR